MRTGLELRAPGATSWPARGVRWAGPSIGRGGTAIGPTLNVNDFVCFLNKFAAGDGYANCDGSTIPPVLNAMDFGCFLNQFAAGCS